jgi:biotin-(acetyl-CoA carboxylase) ligase
MVDFVDWRVRRGSMVRRFSNGLIVQGERLGILELSACLLARSQQPEPLGLLGPLAAACTSEGIRKDTGIVSWLYWPNLVTIDGRVVAKTSMSINASKPEEGNQVLFRILVNCFASRSDAFPSGLPATSILEALGVEIDVDLLRDKIVHALDWYCADWDRGMHRKLVERIRPTIAWLGRDVEVIMTDGQALEGKADGLDEFGSLLLEQRRQQGRQRAGGPTTRTIHPESVELVRVAH